MMLLFFEANISSQNMKLNKRKNINITELRKKLNIKQEEINSLKEEIKKLKDKA